jgi:hypothetical protein
MMADLTSQYDYKDNCASKDEVEGILRHLCDSERDIKSTSQLIPEALDARLAREYRRCGRTAQLC